jgi:hypothetical protein
MMFDVGDWVVERGRRYCRVGRVNAVDVQFGPGGKWKGMDFYEVQFGAGGPIEYIAESMLRRADKGEIPEGVGR